jgi:AhpD family alkylhydroperoxidase
MTDVAINETTHAEAPQPRIPISPTSINQAGSRDLYADYDQKIRETRGAVSEAARPAGALDALTTELVRLRNATLQGCNYCQSFRSRTAQERGMDEPMVADLRGDYEKSELLSERQKVALRLVDAFILGFGHVPEDVARAANAHYTQDEIFEIGLKVFTSSTNKISISLASDDEENAHERFGIRIHEDFYADEKLFNPDEWK